MTCVDVLPLAQPVLVNHWAAHSADRLEVVIPKLHKWDDIERFAYPTARPFIFSMPLLSDHRSVVSFQ